jgi:hypothetical protein
MKYLALLLIPISLFAEVKTTGNLIVNPGFNDGTNGWTLSGDAQRIGDCCPGGHDLEFGDYGSIEQSFNLINDSITQSMLDNGIVLNSTVEVQNGEGGVGSWAPNRGGADTFTIRLQIQDENNEVLATVTQERSNVTGINGKDFSDSLTYTGPDSNIGNIFISGSDANAPANLGGPNVDNISVTMTYDDTVLSVTESAIIATAFEQIEEIIELAEEFIPEAIEEIFIEAVEIQEIPLEILPEIIEVVEIQEEVQEQIIEEALVLNLYEEPQTEQQVTTEIESQEELVEAGESINNEAESEEIIVAEEPEVAREEPAITEPAGGESEPEPGSNTAEEPEPAESTELASSEVSGESAEEERGAEAESPSLGNIDIEEVAKQVAEKIESAEKQMQITQAIVAKAMIDNDKVAVFTNNQTDFFKGQREFDGGDYYETRQYIDDRNLYAQNQNVYDDVVAQYQKNLQDKIDNRIRAEENLRRIRGF